MSDPLFMQVPQYLNQLVQKSFRVFFRQCLVIRTKIGRFLSLQVLMKTLAFNVLHNYVDELIGFEGLVKLNYTLVVQFLH